jgi:two-component sensor histidine kinase
VPPARRGFGSRVLDGVVRGQLGGKILLNWNRKGLVCDVEVPLMHVADGLGGTIAADQAASRR